MNEAIIAAALLLAAAIAGSFLKPTPDQTRPISPDEAAVQPGSEPADHHSH